MPRTTYLASMLSGATPGLSKLARALAGGQQAEQAGFDAQSAQLTKVGQMLAQMRHSDASAAFETAKAEGQTRQNELMRPDAIRERAMLSSGVPLSAADDVQAFLRSGRIDKYDTGGQPGPTMPEPEWARPSNLGAVASQIAQSNAVLAGDAKGADDYFKGRHQLFTNDLARELVEGKMPADRAPRAMALLKASPIFHMDGSGAVMGNYDGRVSVDNPRAQASLALQGAQAYQARAGGADHYAGAALKSANANEVRTGSKGQLRDTDQGLMVVDPRNGQAFPATGPDGKPLGPKLREIPASVNTAIISNSQNLNKALQALALLNGKPVPGMTSDDQATGLKGYLPQFALNFVDPTGVDARAAVSDLGSLVLHDRSGAAVTVAEMPRLAPFIPLPTDSPEAAKKKLSRFVQVFQQEAQALADTYSPEQGYRASPVLQRSASGGARSKPADPLGIRK